MSSYWHRCSVIGTDLIVGWLVEHTDAAPAATANILPMLTKALNTVLKKMEEKHNKFNVQGLWSVYTINEMKGNFDPVWNILNLHYQFHVTPL